MVARKLWIGGNWKCNGSVGSIAKLSEDFNKMPIDSSKVEVVIFPSFVHLCCAKKNLTDKITIGAQNVSKFGPGAYTGEVSVEQLQDIGVNMTLVGHSERRELFNEGCNQVLGAKITQTQSKPDMHVCICIGESKQERESGETMKVIERQLTDLFPLIKDWSRVVIAYEPVWAIGTGLTASPEMAEATHKDIRALIEKKVSKEVSDSVRIVYGGSMNDSNAAALLSMPNIDGGLVGGASLKPAFATIVAAANAQ
eukprot:GHVH01008162.1.p1 GENE.GHVH01008162.1~~GHVH01008162.1.p1  ORF type:complete len:254 (+),score=47.60 GHVH01008162.1:49-810(+)